MAKLLKIISFLIVVGLAIPAIPAIAVDYKGQLKLQYLHGDASETSFLSLDGATDYQVNQVSFRGLIDHQVNRWAFDIDYLLVAENSVDISSILTTTYQQPTQNYWDLTDTISPSEPTIVEHLLDRANVKYSSDAWVIKLGRQAITWGNGVSFHPLDLFNSFSPDSKDTSYKSGIDAAYFQYLFDSGADLQALWVPRKNDLGQRDSKLDSLAMKYLFFIDKFQAEILLAKDYSENTLGVGLVGPIGDTIWKFDLALQQFENDKFWSFDFNLQYSWQWFERPVTGHFEYFHNGFAKKTVSSLEELTLPVLDRLRKRQIFTVAEKNISTGLQIQLEPLWTLSTNVILELDKNSHQLLASVIYNSSDSSNLLFGLQLSSGKKGSQYGGLYLTANELLTTELGYRFYVRYEQFF